MAQKAPFSGLKMTQAKARKLEGEAIKVIARTPEH